jgi:protein-arginine kinase activator protein McsA
MLELLFLKKFHKKYSKNKQNGCILWKYDAFLRSVYSKTTSQEGFIVNHVIKIPNKNYPTEEELEKLENFEEILKRVI